MWNANGDLLFSRRWNVAPLPVEQLISARRSPLKLLLFQTKTGSTCFVFFSCFSLSSPAVDVVIGDVTEHGQLSGVLFTAFSFLLLGYFSCVRRFNARCLLKQKAPVILFSRVFFLLCCYSLPLCLTCAITRRLSACYTCPFVFEFSTFFYREAATFRGGATFFPLRVNALQLNFITEIWKFCLMSLVWNCFFYQV